MDPLEIDPNFEPQQRARSNTWPLPRPENYVEKDEASAEGTPTVQDPTKPPGPELSGQLPKKNSSRRNAWGNMSYADLITQAIQSAPDTRLTLSQIYDWMVQNVPYFKDKGDSNSSAGWKNSIRHNLSLHNRFMRVQNEGTGKSSWWMINPDAKPGKSARRRATSMETSKYEKKRGRAKKKVEALRNGLDATPSPSSSVSEGLDMFPESPLHPGFQLSPDFRPRASSNASSCGRLSPIPAVESDMHDSQVPPMSPIPWNHEHWNSPYAHHHPPMDRYATEQLVDNLGDGLKIGENIYMECNVKPSVSPHHPPPQLQPIGSNGFAMPTHHYSYQPGPDYARYAEGAKLSPVASGVRSPLRAPLQPHVGPPPSRNDLNPPTSYSVTNLQVNRAVSPQHGHSLSPSHTVDSAGQFSQDSTRESLMSRMGARSVHSPSTSPYPPTTSQSFGALPPHAEPTMLRSALTHKEMGTGGSTPTPSQMMGHLMGALNNNSNIPNDLDLSLDTLQGGFDCNVDEVIKHELSMEGNLDFAFPQNSAHHAHHAHHLQQLQQLQQQQHPPPPPPPPLAGPGAEGSSQAIPGLRIVSTSQQNVTFSAPPVSAGRQWVR